MSRLERKNSPTFEQLTKHNRRMPVLVYEKIRTGKFLLINRYRNKLVFIGKLNVIGLLLLGLTGYWYLNGTRYHNLVLEGLLGIMTTAKLDDRMYQVTDWNHKKGKTLGLCKSSREQSFSESLGSLAVRSTSAPF